MVRFDLCLMCGKWVFAEAWRAALAAGQLATRQGKPAAFYWSPGCRAYHITSKANGRRGRVRPW